MTWPINNRAPSGTTAIFEFTAIFRPPHTRLRHTAVPRCLPTSLVLYESPVSYPSSALPPLCQPHDNGVKCEERGNSLALDCKAWVLLNGSSYPVRRIRQPVLLAVRIVPDLPDSAKVPSAIAHMCRLTMPLFPHPRRVVTGHDESGRAIVVSDSEIPSLPVPVNCNFAVLYETFEFPCSNDEWKDPIIDRTRVSNEERDRPKRGGGLQAQHQDGRCSDNGTDPE